MLKLYLLRHGKSDWAADYRLDHDRPLAKRGRRAAVKMGSFLLDHDVAPEVLVTSSALRAKTTLELVAGAAGWSLSQSVAPLLYGAGPLEVLQVAEHYRGDAASILLCGHEPWCSDTVALLTGQPAPGFPTATVACLTACELAPGAGTLKWLQRPRELDE